VNFALMMSQMEGGCPVDYNTITDLFLQVSFVFIYTCFLASNILLPFLVLCNLVASLGLYSCICRGI
jgi:hypothetical protein